jgi:zinc protease
MTIQRKALLILSSAIVLAGLSLAGAQSQPASGAPQTAALTDTIPLDPNITTGRFDNGLRYYVRANKRPQNRVELRLAVNVGSTVEDDDQLGLAHFVEHMAFNGTKHFAKQEIINFMQSIGMRFGPSLNAFTSFDETIYILQIPADKPEIMEKAFLVLEDWAHNLSFDPVEIDKERGVVIEEWRTGRGAGMRMVDKLFPILLKGSRYADRIPIGKKEILESFKHERLTKFYSDWYRPDLMAVMAVGDFDTARVEGLIKKHFASIPMPPSPRVRPTFDVPDRQGTVYAIATDKEATNTSVEIDQLFPARKQGTVGVYRARVLDRLVSGMLSARLTDLSQKPDPPFAAAFAGRGGFIARGRDAATLGALVREGGIDRGLDALVTESQRAARFGFVATELERQKVNTLRNYERLLAQKDTRDSAAFINEYIRNFTVNEPVPGIEHEYALHQRFLPEITLDEINAHVKGWFPESNRAVVVNAAEKSTVKVPDEAQLATVIKTAFSRDITPYVDTVGTATLMESAPAPGKVVKTTTKDPYEITEWELANGVKVVLKPTTNRQDEVVFRAMSPGGTSLASDADFIPASTAAMVVSAGGLGNFTPTELRKVLTGKVANVSPFISELEEGLSGNASPKDLETLFQLIHLTFTKPRADPALFQVLTAQRKAFLANQGASPNFAFSEMLSLTLTKGHLRARIPTAAQVDQWNLDKSFAFYKDRFADASDFTFFFVGNIDQQAMRPLVERYLGSLPSINRKETWKNVGIDPPTGVIEKVVYKGIEPSSRADIVFTGPFKNTPQQRIAIRAMALVLQNRLRETLREDLGGTYGVAVAPSYTKIPDEEYRLTIDFGCDPKRTEELVKTVFREIESLKATGPTEQQTADVRENQLRDYETNVKQNAYLLTQIYLKYQVNEDLKDFFDLPEMYKKLDAATIHAAARTYLNTGNYVRVTLYPEEKK